MPRVLTAPLAVLAHVDAVRVVALGLVGLVVAALALLAREGDSDPNISTGHEGDSEDGGAIRRAKENPAPARGRQRRIARPDRPCTVRRMPAPVFLIGGGRDPEGVAASHRPFVAACGGGPLLCLVLEDDGEQPDLARWTGGLEAARAAEGRPLVGSPSQVPGAHAPDGVAGGVGPGGGGARRPRGPLRGGGADALDGVAGVYVAGGWTPGYQEVLCGGAFAAGVSALPYAGFSAGAAIAATSALVGGWRLDGLPVCDEDAGEGLDELEVRPGL